MKNTRLTNSSGTVKVFIVSALSCLTWSNGEGSPYQETVGILPSEYAVCVNVPPFESYIVNNSPVSNETVPVDSSVEDFAVLTSFAERILGNTVPMDAKIQEVINDYFWDML